MTEQAPHINHEALAGQPANVELARELVSPETVAARTQWLKDQMNGEYDPAMGHIGKLLERSDIQRQEAMRAWESNSADGIARIPDEEMKKVYKSKLEQSEKTTKMAYKTFGHEAINRYHQLESELSAIQREEYPIVEFHEGEANTVFANLLAETQKIDDGIDREHRVPPTEMAESDRRDYENYLLDKIFIDHDQLKWASDKGVMPIRLFSKEGFTIPTSNVVSAGSFSDWRGRDGGQGDKDYQRADGTQVIGRSLDAVIDYASRETPLPAIEGVTAYIQPNGLVLFEAPNSNHRTAAHIARGEDTMHVDGAVTIQVLKENIIREQG